MLMLLQAAARYQLAPGSGAGDDSAITRAGART
jgi:hypothetical protein